MEIKKIDSIARLYYSRKDVQEVLLNFAKGREVVPSYRMESFGKRPDTIQYPSDIQGLVRKGATSFHASEEIWKDPLAINSEMSQSEANKMRRGWDLLIDIDSKYLDYSKIAVKLIIDVLEEHGVRGYGIKFSGSKGFHIIVPGEAFPAEYNGVKTSEMFPEWARAISEYLTSKIRTKYNKIVSEMDINFDALEKRTNLSKKDVTEAVCPECGRAAEKKIMVKYECTKCGMKIQRKNVKPSKRKLKCPGINCFGELSAEEEEYYHCEYCDVSNFAKENLGYTNEFEEGVSGNKLAGLDLVLVAPRHLFRMPYSLHEKTALASVVLAKEEIQEFTPKDADPLKVKIRNFIQNCRNGEGRILLSEAINWKGSREREEEKLQKKKYTSYEKIEFGDVDESMFPIPIKKLLSGLEEGRKRGLFVLLTFLKSLNFSAEYINKNVREWNQKNKPPLKEGYIKSQIEWHIKQRKNILPPNYSNDNFYKDLKLVDKKPDVKNPIVEVIRKIKRKEGR